MYFIIFGGLFDQEMPRLNMTVGKFPKGHFHFRTFFSTKPSTHPHPPKNSLAPVNFSLVLKRQSFKGLRYKTAKKPPYSTFSFTIFICKVFNWAQCTLSQPYIGLVQPYQLWTRLLLGFCYHCCWGAWPWFGGASWSLEIPCRWLPLRLPQIGGMGCGEAIWRGTWLDSTSCWWTTDVSWRFHL